jgi:hypothetical protein
MARACSSRYAPLIQLRKPLDDSALKKYPVIRPAVICAGMNRRDALVPIRLQGLHKGIRLRGKTVIDEVDWDQAGVSDGRDGGRGGAVSVLRARFEQSRRFRSLKVWMRGVAGVIAGGVSRGGAGVSNSRLRGFLFGSL